MCLYVPVSVLRDLLTLLISSLNEKDLIMKMTLKIILYIRENSTFCLTSCKNYEIHFQSMLFFQKCEIFVKAAYFGKISHKKT